MLSELWSGHEKLTGRRTDRRIDGDHDIIRPAFDGRIKINLPEADQLQFDTLNMSTMRETDLGRGGGGR